MSAAFTEALAGLNTATRRMLADHALVLACHEYQELTEDITRLPEREVQLEQLLHFIAGERAMSPLGQHEKTAVALDVVERLSRARELMLPHMIRRVLKLALAMDEHTDEAGLQSLNAEARAVRTMIEIEFNKLPVWLELLTSTMRGIIAATQVALQARGQGVQP
jgi:hypothetical protein